MFFVFKTLSFLRVLCASVVPLLYLMFSSALPGLLKAAV